MSFSLRESLKGVKQAPRRDAASTLQQLKAAHQAEVDKRAAEVAERRRLADRPTRNP
jgi:hypothetical protein